MVQSLTPDCLKETVVSPKTALSLAAFMDGGSLSEETSSVLDFTSVSSLRSLLVFRAVGPVTAEGVGLTTAWSVQKHHSRYPKF